MNRTASAALVTALMVMPLSASAAESFYTASVGAEMWLASTKIDNTRRDDANAPNLYFTFEHGFPYLPNVGLRYTNLEADFASFDNRLHLLLSIAQSRIDEVRCGYHSNPICEQ